MLQSLKELFYVLYEMFLIGKESLTAESNGDKTYPSIDSSLSMEDIKKNISEIGFFQYTLLRDKWVNYFVIIPFLLLMTLVAPFSHIAESPAFSIIGLILKVFIIIGLIILPILIIVGGIYIIFIRNNIANNRKLFLKIIKFLEGAIERLEIIKLEHQELEQFIAKDALDCIISPTTVLSIQKNIDSISENIKGVTNNWMILEKEIGDSKLFQDEFLYKEYLNLFRKKYYQEISHLSIRFQKDIKQWIEIHKKELEYLEDTITNQENQTQTSKGNIQALTMQGIRLQDYINSIKQVQFTI